jgi:hypothetical protein
MRLSGAPTHAARFVSAVSACAIAAGVLAASPVEGAVRSQPDVRDRVTSWDTAAARLGVAGSLWEPTETGSLARATRISVVAGNLSFADGAVASGDTYASVRYASGRRSIKVSEKWAVTGWAVPPRPSPHVAKVRSVVVPLGLRGATIPLTADVYANCYAPTSRRPRPAPARFRCTRDDVLRTGGVLMMTARPATAAAAPGQTTVVIESAGLTFDQLVRIARRLQQVAGSSAAGAGSAQMVGMCRQMVQSGMAPEQAAAFASAYGYTTRIGSVDGVGLAVTADYRPDRFTLSVTANAVVSCTYG